MDKYVAFLGVLFQLYRYEKFGFSTRNEIGLLLSVGQTKPLLYSSFMGIPPAFLYSILNFPVFHSWLSVSFLVNICCSNINLILSGSLSLSFFLTYVHTFLSPLFYQIPSFLFFFSPVFSLCPYHTVIHRWWSGRPYRLYGNHLCFLAAWA